MKMVPVSEEEEEQRVRKTHQLVLGIRTRSQREECNRSDIVEDES
jgi:hypothetical protein